MQRENNGSIHPTWSQLQTGTGSTRKRSHSGLHFTSMLRGKMGRTTVTFEFWKQTHHHLQTTTVTGIKIIKKMTEGFINFWEFWFTTFQIWGLFFFLLGLEEPKASVFQLESRKVNHFQPDAEEPLNGEPGKKVALTPKPNLDPDPSGDRLTDQLINLLTSCGEKWGAWEFKNGGRRVYFLS